MPHRPYSYFLCLCLCSSCVYVGGSLGGSVELGSAWGLDPYVACKVKAEVTGSIAAHLYSSTMLAGWLGPEGQGASGIAPSTRRRWSVVHVPWEGKT